MKKSMHIQLIQFEEIFIQWRSSIAEVYERFLSDINRNRYYYCRKQDTTFLSWLCYTDFVPSFSLFVLLYLLLLQIVVKFSLSLLLVLEKRAVYHLENSFQISMQPNSEVQIRVCINTIIKKLGHMIQKHNARYTTWWRISPSNDIANSPKLWRKRAFFPKLPGKTCWYISLDLQSNKILSIVG